MENSLIGQIVHHEGKIYQILSDGPTMLTAHSYGDNCDIDTTIFVSKKTGKVLAIKNETKKERRN